MINYEQLEAMLVETEEELIDTENDNRELTTLALRLALELLDYKQDEIDVLRDLLEDEDELCMCPDCRAEREAN